MIFDMDGVIVDSELHWQTLERPFLQSLAPAWNPADHGRLPGLSMRDIHTLLVAEYGATVTREELEEGYKELAEEIYRRRVSLIPGCGELIARLNRMGAPVALASSSPYKWIDITLDKFNLHPAFNVVVSADELHGEGKPSPAIYLLAARKLSLDPADCLVIEDSGNGVLSAKRAGMFCVGLRNGFNSEQDFSPADLIIHSFSELDYQALVPL